MLLPRCISTLRVVVRPILSIQSLETHLLMMMQLYIMPKVGVIDMGDFILRNLSSRERLSLIRK